MRIARHVVARKDQWLVALPAELRRHLKLVPGVTVWWHIGAKGRATLTLSGRTGAGRPTTEEDCRTCAKYREELDRLRRELRDGETATAAAWWRQGFHAIQRELFWDLDDLVKAVRALLLAHQLQGARAQAPTHPVEK